MSVFLKEHLAKNPDVTPYGTFDIPTYLLGDENRTPHEYLEAQYETIVEAISNEAKDFAIPDFALGDFIASKVCDFIATPGNWFIVASEAKAWNKVYMPTHLAYPDIWILHYVMIADVMLEIWSKDFDIEIARDAGRYVDAHKPIVLSVAAGDIVFPNE